MTPISELTFEHGLVLLRRTGIGGSREDDLGALCVDGNVRIKRSSYAYSRTYFDLFLPLSEIAQLQEASK